MRYRSGDFQILVDVQISKYSLPHIVAGVFYLAACRPGSSPLSRIAVGQDTLIAASSDPADKNAGNNVEKESRSRTQEVRSVILMIGDGMGPQQMGLWMSYAQDVPHSTVPERMTAMEKMMLGGSIAIVRTDSYDTIVAEQLLWPNLAHDRGRTTDNRGCPRNRVTKLDGYLAQTNVSSYRRLKKPARW